MELLSPAGTLEKLKTAIQFGADAVYAGTPDFSLRSRINDFDYDKIKEGVEFARQKNKKVYATLNIYAHNKHLDEAKKAVKKYQEAGVDALIVSDPGILSIIKKEAPEMPVHLSTQANCCNWQAAKFWHNQGVSRIVLARETTLEEIKEIHEKLPEVELEYFVHGAMCVSYSGRCILSKLLSDRSANQGWCSQPCRWAYKISPADEEDKEIEIDEDRHGTYILNSKDLCLIEYLDKLRDAGITSFKIEGRTKSVYYVAAITKLYRQAIDNNFKPPADYKEELEKLMNRGYTSGFLFGEEKCEHNFSQSHKDCDWQFVGEVVNPAPYCRNNNLERETKNYEKNFFQDQKINSWCWIKVHNELFAGEKVEIITPDNIIEVQIENMRDAETGEEIQEAHGGQDRVVLVSIGDGLIVSAGAIVRKSNRAGG